MFALRLEDARMTVMEAASGKRVRMALLALIFFGTILNYVDRQVVALLSETLKSTFTWSDRDFGHLGTAVQVGTICGLFFVGWFVDRVGVRYAYAAAVAVWSLAGMAHAFAATIGGFVAARIILAAAESVNSPCAVKAAATYLPIKERSLGLGIINTAPNIGAILAPLIVPGFAAFYGWKAAFLVTGALGFIWLIFWFSGTKRLVPLAAAPQDKGAQVKGQWRELFADRRTWAIAGAKLLSDQVWWFMLFWAPKFFTQQFGMTEQQRAFPLALCFTLAALGAVTSGFLFPRLLATGRSVNVARKTSMIAYSCLILPLPLALTLTSPWAAAGLIGLALFAHQGFSTNIFGMAADTIPTHRIARVFSIGAIFGNLSGIAIIEFTGWALDSGVGYWPMFALASVSYLLATLWVHIMVPKITAFEG
jgi:MFS transporter, ACS family, hexuronate transporter